ncbi:hypothetical protein SG1710 [Sodalis glossinidius str. 'morsitans']|uniref:Uncharacterized protein n=1 Tax=Sodalis glossinidius (strain morsitans) TaxID=343509 RepID=Q2NS90_SODGM|nr:hypothetical protein SG1710 [Sodalis glossinidius str. 'morsitans']
MRVVAARGQRKEHQPIGLSLSIPPRGRQEEHSARGRRWRAPDDFTHPPGPQLVVGRHQRFGSMPDALEHITNMIALRCLTDDRIAILAAAAIGFLITALNGVPILTPQALSMASSVTTTPATQPGDGS